MNGFSFLPFDIPSGIKKCKDCKHIGYLKYGKNKGKWYCKEKSIQKQIIIFIDRNQVSCEGQGAGIYYHENSFSK